MNERQTAHFSGHVQGVGFRYTTQRVSRGFSVVGFVRNLPDGRVHLVAEGERSELNRFIDEIKDTLSGNIENVTIESGSATGEFDSFSIRVS